MSADLPPPGTRVLHVKTQTEGVVEQRARIGLGAPWRADVRRCRGGAWRRSGDVRRRRPARPLRPARRRVRGHPRWPVSASHGAGRLRAPTRPRGGSLAPQSTRSSGRSTTTNANGSVRSARCARNAAPKPASSWNPPEERIDGRLNDTHGPVPRNCATCKELFVAYGVGGSNRVTCSEVCAREHKRVRQNLDAAYKRQRHDKKRPCPICGETQNMASGTCAGWKCVVVRKNESRRRVLA